MGCRSLDAVSMQAQYVPEPTEAGPILATRWSAMIDNDRDHRPIRDRRQSGYSFVELVITVGMILVITTWAMPSFLNYYRSARVRAGAQVVSAYLNEARQLAIKTNAAVCVFRTSSTTIQYRTATGTTCNASVIAVAGLANTAATYTVTDAVSGRTLTVTVAASGRVSIGP